MDGFNQPSPGIKTTRQINQMLGGFLKKRILSVARRSPFGLFLETTKNRTAKLKQERAAQSCSNNVVKNNGSNAVKGGKNENGIF